MASVADDTTSGKETAPQDDGQAGSSRRRRPSAKAVAHGARVGVDAVRRRIASVIWIVAALCAVVLVLAALLTALGPANQQNAVVEWLTGTADVLAGPFGGADGGMFDFGKGEDAKNALSNWGVAAVFYLVAGRLLDRVVRP